jgi:polyisoprenoid-binding protein YceI
MRSWKTAALFCLALMPSSQFAAAQPTTERHMVRAVATRRVPVRSDSKLWLEGSSNVRDWTCRATSMDASIEIETDGGATGVKAVAVKVPVEALKCGDRHMEAHMYTALKAKDPASAHILAHFDRLPESVVTGQKIETSGRLTIAGVERTVKMTVSSDRLPDGTRRARGTVPILMTDFGIKPPRPWGGILRTADKVLIQFEIFISPIE